MATELRSVTVKFNQKVYDQLLKISVKKGVSFSDTVRDLINLGLTERVYEENTGLIARVVRQQLEQVLKPHTERLAALSSKSGHMSATAAFLNVQALMDLVPKENRKDVRVMYESARKKAAVHMTTKAADWINDMVDEIY